MVPSLRSWLAAPVRALRASRALALLAGLAVGAAALFAVDYYAHPSLYEYLLLPLGVGGSAYYLAHYDLTDWEQDAMVRGFLRNFAIVSVPMMFVSDDAPLSEYLLSFMTAYGVIFLAVLTAVVDVVDADGDDDAGDGDHGVEDANRPSTASAVDAD
ncbi:hypothetical protein [Halorubellus salinus]|uniref:hypothetical protein n=1 Tax=Halorubellus salinus TaxID=755309 RepID=UPI001D08A143|nr:hypothetical protein [Halorubellus salinus]